MDVQELYEWKLLEKEIDDCDDFVEVLNTLLAFAVPVNTFIVEATNSLQVSQSVVLVQAHAHVV